MSLVPAAADAVVLHARQDQLVVGRGAEASGNEVEEARPPGAALVLGLRLEERQLAAGAHEGALALLGIERARARALGALLPKDVELLRREALAPLVVGEVPLLVIRLRGGMRGAVCGEEAAQGGEGA